VLNVCLCAMTRHASPVTSSCMYAASRRVCDCTLRCDTLSNSTARYACLAKLTVSSHTHMTLCRVALCEHRTSKCRPSLVAISHPRLASPSTLRSLSHQRASRIPHHPPSISLPAAAATTIIQVGEPMLLLLRLSV
jgi:hypothetical protein